MEIVWIIELSGLKNAATNPEVWPDNLAADSASCVASIFRS